MSDKIIRTRRKSAGREPSLRDRILALLVKNKEAMTAREIAEQLILNKTTPFRPLETLIQMELVSKTEDGIDGIEFSANLSNIAQLENEHRR